MARVGDRRVAGSSGGGADELAVGDAVVGVADDQLAALAVSGVAQGQAAGLFQGVAADRRDLIGELDFPVAAPVMIDADEWVGRRCHTCRVPLGARTVIRDNPRSPHPAGPRLIGPP
jgi:hypothetical protein